MIKELNIELICLLMLRASSFRQCKATTLEERNQIC